MTVLVVGQGSIRIRQRRLLSGTGNRVAVVSAKEPEAKEWHKNIYEAIRHEQPAYAVIDGEIVSIGVNQDFTYVSQHRALLNGNLENAWTFEEGLEVFSFIDAIERPLKIGKCVYRT